MEKQIENMTDQELVDYLFDKVDVKKTIYKMLTENTGTHFLDSGGASNRNWQRNQIKTIKDFQDEPEATLSFDVSGDDIDLDFNVSVFHKLSKVLDECKICKDFNSMKVNNWDSQNYMGVSKEGEKFLNSFGFSKLEDNETWNTYNWDNCFSQVVQGTNLISECSKFGENYVLIQIHQGADVRGGYTDAKLFIISDGLDFNHYSVHDDSCMFSVLNPAIDVLTKDMFNFTRDNMLHIHKCGYLSNGDGLELDQEYIKKFATLCNYKTISGTLYE
jgi:hypothetical protein